LPATRKLHRLPFLPLAAGLALSGCASLPATGAPGFRGVPGFDTRVYPGAAAMETWRQASPYRWVGYYLPAPCHTGTSWMGKRAELEGMGWGTAVLFVGEQDWGEIPGPAETPAPAGPARCTQVNLTTAQGTSDAAAASAAASAEGFPAGTVIYLNVERVENVSTRLIAYTRAWIDGLLDGGRYVPGLYAHERNAEQLYAVMAAAFARRGLQEVPRLWIASSRDFDLTRSPAESPVPWAAAWQGVFEQDETWGGVTLRIDASVARSASPSR
jgi:hypothetical protein